MKVNTKELIEAKKRIEELEIRLTTCNHNDNTCYSCKDTLCDNCETWCNNCDEMICKECKGNKICPKCNKVINYCCGTKGPHGDKYYHSHCLKSCYYCPDYFICVNCEDKGECITCGKQVNECCKFVHCGEIYHSNDPCTNILSCCYICDEYTCKKCAEFYHFDKNKYWVHFECKVPSEHNEIPLTKVIHEKCGNPATNKCSICSKWTCEKYGKYIDCSKYEFHKDDIFRNSKWKCNDCKEITY